MRQFLALILLLTLFLRLHAEDAPAITIEVDARELPRKLLHTTIDVPTQPGTLRFWYPQWFPGSHGPHGRVEDIGGFRVETTDGRTLPWKRDDINLHCVAVQIPEGMPAVRVKLDTICNSSNLDAGAIYSYGNKSLGIINWNTCLVYPEGPTADNQPVILRLRLPEKWEFATALKGEEPKEGLIKFNTVSLTHLIDSPLVAGENLRTIKLDTGDTPPAFMHLVSESKEALKLSDRVIAKYSKLVREAVALFGVAHYQEFHFLVTCSNEMGRLGLEHLGSSINGVMERDLIEDQSRRGWVAMLIPHEYTHSWCGKYRRPAGMVTPNFHTPQKTKLLWVYEGLTQYLGDVLMVRSGLVTPNDYRQTLASYIREMQKHVGRNWRSLEDTSIAGYLLRRPSHHWPDLRRDQDFYYEGMLLWLECDAIIREKTKGAKSFDDFCKIFFAAVPGKKTVAEYEFSDVVAALNKVVENDWEQFLTRRVTLPQETLPLDVVTMIGYKMGFTDKPPVSLGRFAGGGANAIDSLGVTFFGGQVGTVIPNMPGDKAGLAPGMTILGVNGKKFSAERLREALAESVKKKSLDFLIEDGDSFKTVNVPYEGGVRYSDMTRAEGKPDVLAEIMKGRAK